MSETMVRLKRAELIKLRMDELLDESKHTRDPERLSSIEAESQVLIQSLRDIRREQLEADVKRYSTPPADRARRSFWDGFWSVFGVRR